MQVTHTDEVKEIAVDALERTAVSLRDAAARGGSLGIVASRTADGMALAAAYLRRREWKDLASDAENTARRYPEAALVTAAAVGFLLGTAWRNR